MKTSASYPPTAARALGVLTSRNNDIEVYVEDTGTPNLWLKLLRRYLPANRKLNSVNVLGSKTKVIQACKLDQQIDGRKKLYIIDADLELLTGRKKPRLRHLYRLRGYCVENYLLEESALVSAVTTLNTAIDESFARRQIDFDGWWQRNRRCLESLFVCYAVTYELKRAEQTVGFSVYRLLESQNSGDLSESKVSARIIQLYRKVRADVSKEDARLVYDKVRTNAASIGVTRFASGKHYLFPPIYQLIKSNNSTNITVNSFMVLVAQCLDNAKDPYLLRRIRKVLA